jgi:hypothetical protein
VWEYRTLAMGDRITRTGYCSYSVAETLVTWFVSGIWLYILCIKVINTNTTTTTNNNNNNMRTKTCFIYCNVADSLGNRPEVLWTPVCVPLAWQETIVSWQFVRQTARTVCTDMQE